MGLDSTDIDNKLMDKRNYAYYIDTYSKKSSHEMFNASLMLMCSAVFQKVECRMGQSSYENLLKIIKRPLPNNVNRKNTFVVPGDGRISLILRYVFSAMQNLKFLILCPKESTLVFPFNNLVSLSLINFFNKFFKRKIIVFCHSEMEGIAIDSKHGGSFHQQLTRLCRNFFLDPNTEISEGLYFSVLGDVLKKNISERIGARKAEKFICVDHPYIFDDQPVFKKKDHLLNLATVGSISKTKGLTELIEFSKKTAGFAERIKLSVVGTTHEDISLFNGTHIELASENNVLLHRDEFEQRISKLDYILFFYHKDSYRITASGAVMDAISYEKPIIALRNDYFEYLFTKYGQFGYLCDSLDEMVEKVEELSINSHSLSVDFKSIKKSLTPELISRQLFDELTRICFLKT